MAPSLSKAMGSPNTPLPLSKHPQRGGTVHNTLPPYSKPTLATTAGNGTTTGGTPDHNTPPTRATPMSNNPRYQHVNRQRQRQRWKAQALPCAICGQAIDYTLKAPHPYSFVIDEIIPLKHGGTLTYDNQEPAHWWCNRIKSTHSLTWARRKVHELIQQGNAPQHDHNHTTTPIAPSHWFD